MPEYQNCFEKGNTLAKCPNLLSFPRKRKSSIKQFPPKGVSCLFLLFLQVAKMLRKKAISVNNVAIAAEAGGDYNIPGRRTAP